MLTSAAICTTVWISKVGVELIDPFFDIAEKILINNGALYPYNEIYRGNWAFLKGYHSWIAVMSQMALLQLQGSNTMPHMAEAEEMVWTLTWISLGKYGISSTLKIIETLLPGKPGFQIKSK